MFPDVETPLTLNGQPLERTPGSIFTTYSTPPQPAQNAAVSVRELAAEGDSRQWEIAVGMEAMPQLNDLFLQIEFEGDVAQLFLDNTPVADWFYDGRTWEIGLRRFADRLRVQPFRLNITPLSAQQEIYFDLPPTFRNGRALALKSVAVVPQYAVSFVITKPQ
ncbi:glycoside hydrolase family 35 [Candidatus Moduliflexus flocculans]|uniref:Glycoside hydrolase family 35 n=1 Tax=Candidatus Moduliflexus flocculans TaxID=1499966 RepID=A0A081BQA8_9BACT|nr:glycoside hydrolase family 35 [Candidatus Moduliflexus flocculans]